MAKQKGVVQPRGKITYISNTDQIIININEDKLRLKLNSFKEMYAKAFAWSVPFGFFLSLLQSFFTSEFIDVFGIKKENIKVFFIVITVIFGLWFLFALTYAIKALVKKETSIEKLVERIKNES
jgi:hypothetical protein